MRFGVYYSGGLDWTFEDRPLGAMSDVIAAIPRGDYPDYAAAHLRELIARYRPSVLWNDIAWPSEGKHLWPLLTEYYDGGARRRGERPVDAVEPARRRDALRCRAQRRRQGRARARRGRTRG